MECYTVKLSVNSEIIIIHDMNVIIQHILKYAVTLPIPSVYSYKYSLLTSSLIITLIKTFNHIIILACTPHVHVHG